MALGYTGSGAGAVGDIFSPSRASPGGLLPGPCAHLSCDPAHTTVPTMCHPRVTPALREPDRGREAGPRPSGLFHEHPRGCSRASPHRPGQDRFLTWLCVQFLGLLFLLSPLSSVHSEPLWQNREQTQHFPRQWARSCAGSPSDPRTLCSAFSAAAPRGRGWGW